MERITQFYTPKNKKKTQSQLDAREKKKSFDSGGFFHRSECGELIKVISVL
jgi:hypothetical protein